MSAVHLDTELGDDRLLGRAAALRRTFATRLGDRGVPLEDVQRLGRWFSLQVLLELYSASDERVRRAAEDAADAIDGD